MLLQTPRPPDHHPKSLLIPLDSYRSVKKKKKTPNSAKRGDIREDQGAPRPRWLSNSAINPTLYLAGGSSSSQPGLLIARPPSWPWPRCSRWPAWRTSRRAPFRPRRSSWARESARRGPSAWASHDRHLPGAAASANFPSA